MGEGHQWKRKRKRRRGRAAAAENLEVAAEGVGDAAAVAVFARTGPEAEDAAAVNQRTRSNYKRRYGTRTRLNGGLC